MKKIVVIGAGDHSERYHLPALKEYSSRHPDSIELTALCELRREHAEAMIKKFGFKRYYENYEEMLEVEKPDGCIAVTEIAHTKEIVSKIIPTGVPLLMEKPPGATVEEAREISAMVTDMRARVMVSVNRRFNPVLKTALSYLADRPLKYLHAVMLRHERTELDFIYVTALHAVDVMRHIAGEVIDYSVTTRKIDGVYWYSIQLNYESGTYGLLEVIPSCGCRSETYEFFGADYRILADVTEDKPMKVTLWENAEIAKSEEVPADPSFVSNGTYNETVEFVSSIIEDRSPKPAPDDVTKSMELCQAIYDEFVGI